jgi:arabinogalactan endo-1,4-beta-galactosidase
MRLLGIFALLPFTRALTYRGADISSVPVVEAAGIKYTDGGTTKAFENIMTAHGGNTARVRVWTAGTYNTAFAISMGKRIKAAGMTLIVDLHYSDTCRFLPLATFAISLS